jgi:NTP pyrophosphatase (non-canonical NTP hydrolase)
MIGGYQQRIMRFLEEALELAQALGMTEAECQRVARYVFSRPIGQPGQEVGGVMVTLAALCHKTGIDMQGEADREAARIDTSEMRLKIFEKQAFKRSQGLTSDGGFRSAPPPAISPMPADADGDLCPCPSCKVSA